MGLICLLLPPRPGEGGTAWGLHPIGAGVVEPERTAEYDPGPGEARLAAPSLRPTAKKIVGWTAATCPAAGQRGW